MIKLTGTFVNMATVIVGSLIGILIKKGIPEKYREMIMSAVGLSVIFVGISGLSSSKNTIVLILSMVTGTVIGTLLKLDTRINALGEKLQKKFSHDGNSKFAEGFVTSTLLFCVGAMAVVGSLESGIKMEHTTLFSKSVLDGISSLILASSLGAGVIFSVFPVLVYQGGITLLAGLLVGVLSDTVVAEMSAVGSLLILAIGLNMLKITEIKVMNMLPAIFLPILFCTIPLFA